jgi:hypothetical protein
MKKQGNTYKPEEKAASAKKTGAAAGRQLHSLLDGSFLARGNINTWLPFIGFLALLGLLYIHNSYMAERRIRQLNRIDKELIELHYDYIQIKSALGRQTQPSVLEADLEKYGIRRLESPPAKIFIIK